MNAPFQSTVLTEGASESDLTALYADPYISRIGHDQRPAAPIVHPQVTYLSAWVAGSFAGAFMVIRAKIDYEIHALLYQWALPWSRVLAKQALAWCFSHPIVRVSTQIIQGFEKARNLCLKLGFREEGVKRAACTQNGIPKSVYLLGMLRSESCLS